MKHNFTVFQKIMTVLFIALEIAVAVCDIYKLVSAGQDSGGKYYYAVNLALCVLLLAVFLVLIFDPKICVSEDDTDKPEQLYPLISASRTYMCFIAVDIAAIFAFVMFFSKYFKHPALIIVIGGVLIFIAGAVKYIIDSRKIGFADPDEEGKENAAPEAAEAVTDKAEEATEETVETEEAAEEPTEEAEQTEEAAEETAGEAEEIAEASEEAAEEAVETVEAAEKVTEETEQTEEVSEETAEEMDTKQEEEPVSET